MESFFNFCLGTTAILAAFVIVVLILVGLTGRNLYREVQYQLARREEKAADHPPTERQMKHQAIFWIVLALFAASFVIPDFVPFLDEILLGLLAAYFGLQRETVPVDRPLLKDVTPIDVTPIDLGEVESREVE